MALRTDIDKALDELISNEGGMRFQGLAVVLAKQQWPELIACERKKDLGLDAYTPSSLARDGKGKGLACSVTATLEKIKSDIRRFRENYTDVKLLIFSTPLQVTNQTAVKWAEAVYQEYSLELITVSRENIITELMLPSNASVCRNQLGIQVPVEPTLTELIEKAREATSEVIQSWLSNPRLTGKPRIALQMVKIDHENRETDEVLELDSLHTALRESRRIVLEAPAGRGKTTTLIQLAERHNGHGELALLLDFPILVRSRIDVLAFIARMPQFLSRSIRAEDLARLYNEAHCSFLLNGWNEISDSYSEDAVLAIEDIERNFSRAGIIVVTRPHHIKPPLPGAVLTKLLSLSRDQRTEYLQQRLASRAEELNIKLDGDRILDDLTRTPLFLSEVTTIFLSGDPIPRTKMAVLDAVIGLVERSDEHRHHLECLPLGRHGRDYLAELASQMTKEGKVTIEESLARSVVHSVSRRLNAAGQIAQPREPDAILSVLCAHHILERLDYSSVTFRFQHQQFQEFLAAVEVKGQLFDLISSDVPDRDRCFARDYINQPAWEEPLRMIAEEIGDLSVESSGAVDRVSAGRRLIELALDIDPIFAADLSRLCGEVVWREVRTAVGERLRAWYAAGNAQHRQCALAGMLASGSDEFTDILLPLLRNSNQQVRLETYRAWGEFHVSSLGGNWESIVGGWQEEQRADFVREVVQERWMAYIAEDFALSDPSTEVRAAALHALRWAGADMALAHVLAASDSLTFRRALQEGLLDPLPKSLRARTVATHEASLEETIEPVERVRIRLAASKAGLEKFSEEMKKDLTEWPPGQVSDTDYWLLKSALELVRKTDPHWVSHWLAGRIVAGSLWADHWVTMLLGIPESLRNELLEKISSVGLEYNEIRRIISVLAATADTGLAGNVFSRMCRLRFDISSNKRETNTTRWEILRQLEDLYRAIQPNVAVSGMLTSRSESFDQVQYTTAVELFGRIGVEGPELRSQLQEDFRQNLRKYLKEGLSYVLSQEDYDGHLKMSLATALARVGDPEDMDALHGLIRADIDRVRQGRAARSRGERGPLANGGAMGCSTCHVYAVVSLGPHRGEEILLQVLNEPEYEQDAAMALLRMAKTETHEKHFGVERPDYRLVWEARAGSCAKGFDEDRRRRYTIAIRERIVKIQEDRSKSDKPELFNGRLKGLAKTLALLDGRHSAGLVLDIMALPGQWDGWTRTDAVEALLLSGAQLSAENVLTVLNPTIEHALSTGRHDQQSVYLLQRCLCLLPFVEPASEGVARIREINPTKWMHGYELRELVTALGHSRCNDALGLLIEMAESGHRLDGIAGDWVEALAALGTPESKRALLSFVDPDIDNLGVALKFGHYEQARVASQIADIARAESTIRDRLYQLCATHLPHPMRLSLADSITQIGTRDSLLAGLGLIHDDASPPVPPALLKNLETVFVERRPFGNAGNTYSLEPRSANEIRSRIFAMALSDDARKRSAWYILGRIESWRLEYGRPSSEPRHPDIDSGLPWPPTNLLDLS